MPKAALRPRPKLPRNLKHWLAIPNLLTMRRPPAAGRGQRLMNAVTEVTRRHSVCPHDCPSVCALDVEVIGGARIGRIHGARDQSYTSGVVCAKVARYSERIHHPDRLTQPLRRLVPREAGNSSRSVGTRRSTASQTISFQSSANSAPKAYGHTSTPARWVSSCATESSASRTRSATPATMRQSVSGSLTQDMSQEPAG